MVGLIILLITTDRRADKMQNETYFPSFTLFQRADWTSQANMQAEVSPKCFLGWFDEEAPECSANPGAEPSLPCQCVGGWSDTIRDFKWHNTSYRALSFQASKDMVSPYPTIQMVAQTFFSCKWTLQSLVEPKTHPRSHPYQDNTQKAKQDSSRILSPSLYIAVHDPTLTVEEALADGYTRMVLINANGMVAINLGLETREALGHGQAYDYQITISTIPSTTLDCESAATCFLTLIFQFPTFDRQVLRQDVKLKWPDVASLAGSWLAVFQLAGWILSGAAWYV